MNNPSIDELLNKAFNLACFILNDRQTAIQSVEAAMARLDVTTAAQGKRLYYKPSASEWMHGGKQNRYRNKVSFGETQLLQRLIYIASEAFELQKENSFTAGDGAERAMLIHFIKHLVRITTRRNSFYVTLGINRLLYNYSTAETMETYNVVIQDPARVKDDYYYRSRKGVLMQELKTRFGRYLDVARGPRGEERFQASTHQSHFVDAVRECLSVFTPWDTTCLVPAGVNPIVDAIPVLSSRGKQDENKIEVDRIHAVLHPGCYERLVKMLRFESPDTKLEVPHFFLTKGTDATGDGQGGSRNPSSSLSNVELDEIKSHLDDQSSRRKRVISNMLRVVVDGTERARLSPSRSASTRLALDTDAELIEIRSMVNGDDLLLASHLFLDRERVNKAGKDATSITLEGGQKLSITVSASADSTESIVDVEYRETDLLRAASLFFRQPESALAGQRIHFGWRKIRVVPFLVLGLVILGLSIFGITQFIRKRSSESTNPTSATNRQQVDDSRSISSPTSADDRDASSGRDKPEPSTSSSIIKDNGSQKSTDVTTGTQADKSAPTVLAESSDGQKRKKSTLDPDSTSRGSVSSDDDRSQTERNNIARETTRSISAETEVTKLADIKKIFVEVVGDASMRKKAKERLIGNLNGSDRFVSTESRDEADALLKLTVTSNRGQSMRVVARVSLINAQGDTVWHGGNSRGVFIGSYESVTADIVKGLLDDAGRNPQR